MCGRQNHPLPVRAEVLYDQRRLAGLAYRGADVFGGKMDTPELWRLEHWTKFLAASPRTYRWRMARAVPRSS